MNDYFDPRFEAIPHQAAELVPLTCIEFDIEFERLEDLIVSFRAVGLKPVQAIEESLNQPFIELDGMNIFCEDDHFVEFPLNRKFKDVSQYMSLKNRVVAFL